MEKDEFDDKVKELEAVFNPIIKQAYENKSGGSAAEYDEL